MQKVALALIVRSLFAVLFVMPTLALAITENFSYSAAETTRFPLPFPAGTVATTFTGWTGTAFPYATDTFQVGADGDYSFTVGGISSGVGIFVVRGEFQPNALADPVTPLSDVLAGTQAPATIPSIFLEEGVQYSYLVVVSSGSGTGTLDIEGGCIEIGGTVCTTVSDAPTDVQAVAADRGEATVSWTAPGDDGGEPITSYTVTASSGGHTCSATAPATSCLVTGLSTAVSYTFTVVATNAVGNSAASVASNTLQFVAAPIPTLSVWALFLLSGLLAAFGLRRLRQHQG